MTAKKDKPVARKTAGRKLAAVVSLETTDADAPVASLVERIYDELEDRIVSLELPPGAMLSEVTIAREFGVSRTPVGEALQRLAREGLITRAKYRSVFLTDDGRSLAKECRRRHEIVLRFLISLGLDPVTAERDAEGIEHHVSERTLALFSAFASRS